MAAAIEEAINAAAQVDLDALSDDELDAMVTGLQHTKSALAALAARVCAVWERRRVWARDGSRSPAVHLAHRANVSRPTANCDITRGRRLRHMPLTSEAFAAGEIAADRVDLLGRANTIELRCLFLRDEQILLDAARSCAWDDFTTVVRLWKDRAEDEVGDNPVRRRWRDRRLSIVATFEGAIDLTSHGPALEGSIVRNELERIEQQLFDDDLAKARAEHGDNVSLDKLWRDTQQRRFDALVIMATRSASLPDDAETKRPLVTVVVNHPRFADICRIEETQVDINPIEVQRILGDFDVERVVFGPDACTVEVGRRTRVFRGALRRAIQVRVQHCQLHPTCRAPAPRCQVDHTVEYEDGGETTLTNGQLACPHHNRHKHTNKRAQQGRPPPAP